MGATGGARLVSKQSAFLLLPVNPIDTASYAL